MPTRSEKVARFRALHRSGCFVVPNVWDVGSAQIMAGLGFEALATTSSGYAFSVGKRDGAGEMSRDEAIGYAARIAQNVDIPVTADLEDGYAEGPEDVAETVRLAAEAGLAGCSIEDSDIGGAAPSRGFDEAVARVAAAIEAAKSHDIVLTARADGLIVDGYDLDEAIRRLQRFAELGADVVYAPGLTDRAAIERVCASVSAPVNHLVSAGASGLSFDEIAAVGVRRISMGGSLARAAGDALIGIGTRLKTGDFTEIESAPGWSALRGD